MVTAELSVVPKTDDAPGAFPPSCQPVEVVESVPEVSGKVHVRAAVKSAEVIVPVKAAPVAVLCGLIARLSAPEVVELNIAAPVVVSVVEKAPEAWV